MRISRLTLLSVTFVATLALAACGDGEPFDASTLSGTPVSMDEMRFDPKTLTVKAGSDVEIALVNDGSVKHNFRIDDADADEDLSANDGKSFTFTAPDSPGEYRIYCDIPGHASAGMEGTLIVEQ